MEAKRPKPVVLISLDGWGVSPERKGNAMRDAGVPHMTEFMRRFPFVALQASGVNVGLPWGEVGNSEVGHLTMGAGMVIYQSLPRINMAIEDKSIYKNEVLVNACKTAKDNKKKLHILGLCSAGNVHAAIEHLYILLDIADKQRVKDIFIHAILDGRDAPPHSFQEMYLPDIIKRTKKGKLGRLASLQGRYYAMDRNKNWDRTMQVYNALVNGKAPMAEDPDEVLTAAYAKGLSDEEVPPTLLTEDGKPIALIEDGDVVIFFNFRPDRAIQLTQAFVLPSISNVDRDPYLLHLKFVTLASYDDALPVDVAFPPQVVENPIAKVISDAGMKQFHVAETEKFAHVTYFFDGGARSSFPGEDYLLIPSPDVKAFDKVPAMSAKDIGSAVLKEMNKGKYDFILVNFANADMVGHTGNYDATKEALLVVDDQIQKIVDLAFDVGGVVLITADHGKAEQMLNPRTGEIDKEHSPNPIPFLYLDPAVQRPEPRTDDELSLIIANPVGVLADVAPTILAILNIEAPKMMTGTNLLPLMQM